MFSSFTRKRRILLWTAIVGGILTVISLILALVGIPLIIDSVLAEYLVIKNGTDAWDNFVELPMPMDFNLYFFKITNPKDVVEHKATPELVEVGPIVYKGYRKKFDIQRLDEEHVSYYTRQLFEFDSERSTLPEDYELYTLNVLLSGLLQILENSRAKFDLDVEAIIPHVIGTTSLFTKVKLKEFLFDGTPICLSEWSTFESKLICLLVILLNSKMISYNDDLTMSYSLFGWKNNTDDGKFVINTGQKDIMQLGNVQSWNDMTYTNIWKGEESECNKVYGSDIAIFPPYVEEGASLDIFSTDVCRMLSMKYTNTSYFKAIEVYNFELTHDTLRPKENEKAEDSCYCSDFTRGLDGEKSCFLDGILDVYPCLGIPGIVSFPHFLHADQKYSDSVGKLTPDETKHSSYMRVQPLTGVPMEGWIAIQISLIVRPIVISDKLLESTKNLNNFSYPVIWLQQGVKINDELYDIANGALTLLLGIEIGKWVFVAISGLLCMVPASMLLLSSTQ